MKRYQTQVLNNGQLDTREVVAETYIDGEYHAFCATNEELTEV